MTRHIGVDGQRAFDLNDVRHDYNRIMEDEQRLFKFLCDLHTWGTAVVANTPYELHDYEAFINRFGIVRATNWGKWFEVFSNKSAKREDTTASTEDAAYSSDELPLHTDGPYNENPLHFQLLQCLKQSSAGGESQLSDGYTAAMMCQSSTVDTLSTTEWRFRYHVRLS